MNAGATPTRDLIVSRPPQLNAIPAFVSTLCIGNSKPLVNPPASRL